MFELIIFLVAIGSDWLLKEWSMRVLASLPMQTKDLIPDILWMQYAKNYGYGIGTLRSRSWFNTIIKVIVLAIIIYLLLFHRKKMAPITRFGMMVYAAGLLGNQINYWLMDFVPDMLVIWLFPRHVFNLADVFIIIALVILSTRLLFFEGKTLSNSISDKFTKKIE